MTKTEKASWERQVKKLTGEITALEKTLEEIRSNKIYENAFEWRFEFPEVLDNNGKFTGFDVVIGNPPYIRQEELGSLKKFLEREYQVYTGTADILVYFFERGINLLSGEGVFCMITSNKFMKAHYGKNLRNYLTQFNLERIIDFGELPVFEEAATFPAIYLLIKKAALENTKFSQIKTLRFESLASETAKEEIELNKASLGPENWTLGSALSNSILEKMKGNSITLDEFINGQIYYGIKTGFNEAFIIDESKRNELII